MDGLIVVDPSLLPKSPRDLMAAVDDAVASVITKSTRFILGYEKREAAALAFKSANYVGDATEWVTRFARNTGMTDRQAADLILAQADHLRFVLGQLEALRMDKYLILAATSEAGAQAVYDHVVAQVNAVI